MKVWVGCLASYNSGCLHGSWFDLEDFSDLEELNVAIGAKVLQTSPERGEEWAIFDTEDVPSNLSGGMYPDLGRIWEYWEAMEELDESDGEAFAVWVESLASGEELDVDRFREEFAGSADSEESWGWDYLGESGVLDEIPEHLQGYFNMASYVRDMTYNGQVWFESACNGQVFAFWGCC